MVIDVSGTGLARHVNEDYHGFKFFESVHQEFNIVHGFSRAFPGYISSIPYDHGS